MTKTDASQTGFLGRSQRFWAILFIVSTFGASAFAAFALEGIARLIVMILPMGLLVPMAKAGERRMSADGAGTLAIVRYNRRMLLASFGYVLGLGIAISLYNRMELTGIAAFGVALLPTVPTFGMIWAMARYLIEETDEYLRHRTIMAALMALGLVLVVGIFWGFLETFGVVPHVWAWWVLPVWAIGLGIAQSILSLRDKREESA
ncbi:MAG: hypothetical protein WBA51_12965 [Erythrobacter sp.]